MIEFRKYVKENWLTIPTNTQLVERWVKDSNECTFNTKDEGLVDAVAILRSTTIFRFCRKALRLSNDRLLSANQHCSGGKAGSRTNKTTNNLENTNTMERVRGAFYNNLVISEVVREATKLSQLKTPLSNRKQLLDRLKNSHMSYQTIRTNATLTSYANYMANPFVLLNNSTIRATGIDTTDHMMGRFLYGKLGIVHLNLVREELAHRGSEVDTKMRIINLGKYLLSIELHKQRTTYKERAGKDARDDQFNTSTFEPF